MEQTIKKYSGVFMGGAVKKYTKDAASMLTQGWHVVATPSTDGGTLAKHYKLIVTYQRFV